MTLNDLLQGAGATRLLRDGGLGPEAVGRLSERFLDVAAALQGRGFGPDRPVHAFFVPGRIEVLGKHTDYAGGRSIVCAVERGFCVAAVPGAGAAVRLLDVGRGEEAVFEVGEALVPHAGHWSTYPMTVTRRLARNFGALRGGTMAFASDLPRASGMSSSSAFVVASFLALSALNDLPSHPAYRAHIDGPEALAHYLGTVENGQSYGALAGDAGVGTFGGSQDHTAILCAAPRVLRVFAYSPTRSEGAAPLPAGYVLAVGSSGVAAKKTGAAQAKYNRAAALAACAAEAWRAATGRADAHLGAAVASPGFSPERMHEALRAQATDSTEAEALVERFDHFFAENEQAIPASLAALRAGDVDAFGAWVDRSQRGAEGRLHNQIPETAFLAAEARRLGAAAASAFGAGFGGAVWALVEASHGATFLEAWAARYRQAFPDAAGRAVFFLDRTGPAAFRLGAA